MKTPQGKGRESKPAPRTMAQRARWPRPKGGPSRRSRPELLESILHSSFDCILALNQRREIIFCNDAFCTLFGYTPDEVCGRSAEMLHLSRGRYVDFGTTVLPAIRERGHWKGEWSYRRRDGSQIHTDSLFSKRTDTRGRFIGFVAVMRDVTERRQAEKALADTEVKFHQLFENISSGVAVYEVVDSGSDFVFKNFNSAAERIESIRREDVVGRRLTEVFPGVVEFGLLEVMRRVWRTGNPESHPVALYKDERIAGWRENYVCKLPSGEIVTIYNDITERKKAEEALADSEERLQAILNSIQVGIMIIDPEDHTVVDVNPMAIAMIGRSREEIVGRVCHEFICPAEKGRCPITDLGQTIDGNARELLGAAGQRMPVLKTVTPVTIDGRKRLVESFVDITEIKRLEERLQTLAITDPLTGVFNRRHFFDLAEKELARAQRYRHALSLMVIDIDHFKSINDRFGHPAGDAVLEQVCRIIGSTLRGNDVFGRIGGEEFAVMLPETGSDQAVVAAERIRRLVQGRAFKAGRGRVQCTLSLGVAATSADQGGLDKLFQSADDALYEAKRRGRNQVVLAPL